MYRECALRPQPPIAEARVASPVWRWGRVPSLALRLSLNPCKLHSPQFEATNSARTCVCSFVTQRALRQLVGIADDPIGAHLNNRGSAIDHRRAQTRLAGDRGRHDTRRKPCPTVEPETVTAG
jgi:hypothetical protein